MKRYSLLCLILSVFLLLGGCALSPESEQSSVSSEGQQKAEESAGSEELSQSDPAVQNSGSDILIAYFTWADNTIVEDQEAALQSALSHYEDMGDADEYNEVDAISSASIVPPGNSARVAAWIQEQIGGDLFSIQVNEPYPSDYDECMDRAADEKAEDARPDLKSRVENIEQYDTVFVGYPNWWYTCPMAIHSFIEGNDLSGKKIVLFCTHGTGGLASSVQDITESLPEDCTIEKNVLGIYRPDVTSAQSTVVEWLSDIGYEGAESQVEPVTEENMNHQIQIETESGDILVFELNGSSAADSLYEQLPLTVDVEDFSTNEKIFYPPEKLDLTDTPNAEMAVGTLAYYAPWGNVVMFYDTYNPNGDLYELGHVVSGVENIEDLTGKLQLTAK